MFTQLMAWFTSGRGRGLLVCVAYLGLSIGWILFLNIGMGVWIAAEAFSAGSKAGGAFDMQSATLQAMSLLSPLPIGLVTIVQFLGMYGLAYGLIRWLGTPVKVAFAFANPNVGALAAAILGGFTVGIFPGWIAQTIVEHLPFLNLGNLTIIEGLLTGGPWLPRLPLIFAVCVLAPIVEESVFRGFMFDALSRSFAPPVVWVATSVLFAMYHIDPVQGSAVLFTGLFLGWLRWRSGSIWPGMIAHAINNTLATVLTNYFGPSLRQEPTPAWLALVFGTVTVGIAALALFPRRAAAELSVPDQPFAPPRSQ